MPRLRRPLLLVPTSLERELLGGLDAELCGFGPVEAGIGAARAIAAAGDAAACVLVGLAGTYDAERHGPGEVVALAGAELVGVGRGREPAQVSGSELGLEGLAAARVDFDAALLPAGLPRARALTVCAASANAEEAGGRRRRHPEAGVEEMEAWAVARAAGLAGLGFGCLRAVSNLAGETRKERWEVEAAMAALRGVLDAWLLR